MRKPQYIYLIVDVNKTFKAFGSVRAVAAYLDIDEGTAASIANDPKTNLITKVTFVY
mgnify:CR=1 FL=1